MAIERKHMISKWLREILQENYKDTTDPKNKVMAKALVDIALDDKANGKLRLEAIAMIIDRLEGKSVQPTADVTENPFDGVDTAKLEALKAKLQAAQNPPNETKP